MKWKKKWEDGLLPKLEHFDDVYMRVRMRGWTAFLFWFFFVYRDIKRFDKVPYGDTILYRGVNLWVIRWGEFCLVEEQSGSVLFDYNQPDNAWHNRRIVDKVRLVRTVDGLLLGKFSYRIFDRELFLCWFTLERR